MVVKGVSKNKRVQDFLAERGSEGATGRELIQAICSDYGLIICKLRQAGAVIERVPMGSNQSKYILHREAQLA